jgi:hypothetical protein
MKTRDRIIGSYVEEVRERILPKEDCRGFVLLNTGDVVELILHSPWVARLSLPIASDLDSRCLEGTTASMHSHSCKGLQIVDIFKCSTVPSIGIALSNRTGLYMGADERMAVFNTPLDDYYLDDATSWLTGEQISEWNRKKE